MRKIVLLASNSGSGGLIKYINGFLKYTPEGYDVTLFCGEDLKIQSSEKVNIVRTKYVNESGIDLLLNKRVSSELIEMINEICPDIIVFLNGYMRKGLGKYKSISILHNQLLVDKELLIAQKPIRLVFSLLAARKALLYSFQKATGIIFLSEESKKDTDKRKYKYNNGKIILFGQNTEIQKVHPSRKNNLIYVSTGFPYKNHVRLLEALALLNKDGVDFFCTIAGCQANEQMKEIITKNDLDSKVSVIGWVDHSKVKEMILDNDFYVHASLIESTSNGVLEGVQEGMTIVCSNIGVFKEALQDKAYYFNPMDRYDIASAIKKALENPRALSMSECDEIMMPYNYENAIKEVFEYADYICRLDFKR